MLMSTMSSLNISISISIRKELMLMLMSRLSSLAHKLLMLMFMLMLDSLVRTGLKVEKQYIKIQIHLYSGWKRESKDTLESSRLKCVS